MFETLHTSWIHWASLAGLSNVQTEIIEPDRLIKFSSDSEIDYLRHSDGWWAIDIANDRGTLFNNIAQFSALSLAEKYLTWRWSSWARTARGAYQWGPELNARGPNSQARFFASNREHFVLLRTAEGDSILPQTNINMNSHVLTMSLAEINRIMSEGLAIQHTLVNEPDIAIRDGVLYIDSRVQDLPYRTVEACYVDDLIVARVEPPFGLIFNRNVFGVATDQKISWQIEESPHGTGDDKPYTSLRLDSNGALIAGNWNGVDYRVDSASGRVTPVAFMK